MSRLASGKRTPNANSLVHPELFNKGKLTPRRCKTRGEKKRILDLKTFEKKLTICDIDRAEITDESFERDLQKHEEFNDSVNKISFPFAIQTQSERCHTPFSDIERADIITEIKHHDVEEEKENDKNIKDISTESPKFGVSVITIKNNKPEIDLNAKKPKSKRRDSISRRLSILSQDLFGGMPTFTKVYDPKLNWHKPVNNFWDHINRMNRRARRLSRIKTKKRLSKGRKKKHAIIEKINAYSNNKDVKIFQE